MTGDESESWYMWAGYVAAGLIGLRLIWGLIGFPYARFSQFLRGPAAVTRYLGDTLRRREARHIGHNLAAAMMIVAILVTMLATAFAGWLMVEPTRPVYLPEMPQIVAPACADDDGGRGGTGRGARGAGQCNAGALSSACRHHENLARAMITGRKRSADLNDIS